MDWGWSSHGSPGAKSHQDQSEFLKKGMLKESLEGPEGAVYKGTESRGLGPHWKQLAGSSSKEGHDLGEA